MSDIRSSQVTQVDLPALRRGISGTFTLDEIATACFDLGIPYENLPGNTLDAKVRELIQFAVRHGILQDLVAYVQEARPTLVLKQTALTTATSPVTATERAKHRQALRDDRKDIYLVHTLRPSPGRSGWYDILIYLTAHKNADLSTVDFAEFFLGSYWHDQVFRVDNQEGFVGISITAYGPVFCTCRVVFRDNHEVLVERYIDFEMAGLLSKKTSNR
jgi:hypothetical protein